MLLRNPRALVDIALVEVLDVGHNKMRFVRSCVVPVLVVLFVLASAANALAISRATTLARAQAWVDSPVKYSQSRYHKGYRTDCSGYVSMAWQTGTSWWTAVFHRVTHPIKVSELQPGDAMLKPGYHIRLFYGWLDEAHTQYVAYESGNGQVAVVRIHSIADDLAYGYRPVRYDKITYSPASQNLLKNPAFNTWATAWDGISQPVWWSVTSDTPGTRPWRHRRALYHSGTHSIELINPSADPQSHTYLQQWAYVRPGAEYRAYAWALTASGPAATSLHVQYVDALGEPAGEAQVTGADAGLSADAFRRMSLTSTAPSEAVAALVTVRLAGGTSLDASGSPVPGTRVIVDDVALFRPYVSVGIKRSTSSTYRGRTVKVYGSVTPQAAVGATATVQYRVPGGSWRTLRVTKVAPSGSAGAWSASYRLSRSARRGTYWFRTSVSSVPGYVGTTSAPTSIVVR